MPSRPELERVLVVTPRPESQRGSDLKSALDDAGGHVELSTGIGIARLRAKFLAGQGIRIAGAVLDFSASRDLSGSQDEKLLVAELREFFPDIRIVESPNATPEEVARTAKEF